MVTTGAGSAFGVGNRSANSRSGTQPGTQSGGGCACGSGAAYPRCCGPLHEGSAVASTAEDLMRSRYAAFALGLGDYLVRTWHPRTRPDDAGVVPGLRWERLEVLDTQRGQGQDDEGTVEFRAHWSAPGPPAQTGVLHERSRFERRAGRWLYLDGDALR